MLEIQHDTIFFRDVREMRWPPAEDVDANPEIGGPDVALEFLRDLLRMAGTRLSCSFCGKSSEEVARLIAGPMSYICNECVDLCTEILAES